MIYRYHCIRGDGYNYVLAPYFIDFASDRGGINVVGIWRIKEYRRDPAPEPNILTELITNEAKCEK